MFYEKFNSDSNRFILPFELSWSCTNPGHGSGSVFRENEGHWSFILEIRPRIPLGKIVLYNFYVLRFSQFGLQRPQIPLFTKLGSSHPNWQFCSYFHFTSYFAQTTSTELAGA